MAKRCTNTTNLEVHHINRSAPATLSNAQVLCQSCHENTGSYGKQGGSIDPFPESVKRQALIIAGNQCECSRDNCH